MRDVTGTAAKQAVNAMMQNTVLAAAAIMALAIGLAFADPMVGGAIMSANKNIIQNVSSSKIHTTFMVALRAAGLVEMLEGSGPFTVFAPTNEAFDMLPAGTVPNLLKPENEQKLRKIVTYNVVRGRLDSDVLDQYIKDGGGKAALRTVEGGTLTITASGNSLTITDVRGETAKITIPNVYQSNGVIMVTDRVLMPS